MEGKRKGVTKRKGTFARNDIRVRDICATRSRCQRGLRLLIGIAGLASIADPLSGQWHSGFTGRWTPTYDTKFAIGFAGESPLGPTMRLGLDGSLTWLRHDRKEGGEVSRYDGGVLTWALVYNLVGLYGPSEQFRLSLQSGPSVGYHGPKSERGFDLAWTSGLAINLSTSEMYAFRPQIEYQYGLRKQGGLFGGNGLFFVRLTLSINRRGVAY